MSHYTNVKGMIWTRHDMDNWIWRGKWK